MVGGLIFMYAGAYGLIFMYAGAYNVAATQEHTALGGVVAFLEEQAGMTPEEYAQWEARFAPAPGDTAAASSGHAHAPGTPSHPH